MLSLIPAQNVTYGLLTLPRHDALIHSVEVDADALAVVLERLREHRLQLVANTAGVGDLDGARGVVDTGKEAHEQRAEHLPRNRHRLHQTQCEGDSRRRLPRGQTR